MIIKMEQFAGMLPRVDPKLLPPTQAVVATDVDVRTGKLQPLRAPSAVQTLSDALQKTVYFYNSRFLSWSADVDVVRSPIIEDQYQRICYTGDGVPKLRAIVAAAEQEWPLGIPTPTAAPAFTVAQRSVLSTTRTTIWKYQYEEPDGSVLDKGDMPENSVYSVLNGKGSATNQVPARVKASTNSTFILFADVYDSNSALIGRVYPQESFFYGESDLYIQGRKVSAKQTTSGAIVAITFSYSTNNASDYSVYRSYVYTYVSAFGEESGPSEASDVLAVDPSQYANVSGIADPPSGYNVTLKRLYRTVTSNLGTQYQFVADIAVGTMTYADYIEDDDLETVLPSAGWEPPPAGLTGLVYHPSGSLFGFSGRTVHASEPFYPHAWPTRYQVIVDDDIVGLGISGNTVCVITAKYHWLLSGDHPTSMSKFKIPTAQPGVSKRGIASFDNLVLFPSTDGLCAISYADNGIKVITNDYYTKDQWLALSPDTMFAAIYDRKYMAWSDTGAIIFGLYDGPAALTNTAQRAQGAYYDDEQDRLLVIQGETLRQWEGDAAALLPGRWRSKEVYAPKVSAFSVARVVADAYPVAFRVITDVGPSQDIVAITDQAFRLPYLRHSKLWQIELDVQTKITEVLLSTSMQELSS